VNLTKRIDYLIQALVTLLFKHSWKIVLAESCTGGKLASLFTEYAGSSEWFEYGVVSYSNYSKNHFLGVPESVLKKDGPVSSACAKKMVEGLCLQDNFFGIALTGFAGPAGGAVNNPVGTVFIAWKNPGKQADVHRFVFLGNRHEVIQQAIFYALKGSIQKLLYSDIFYKLNYFFALSVDSSSLQRELFTLGLENGLSIEQLEPQDNLHLTLLYLGQISSEKIQQIHAIAKMLSKNTMMFSLQLQKISFWKSSGAFVIESSGSKNLITLANKLKERCGVDDKRAFRPHVTLAKKIKNASIAYIEPKNAINWHVSHLSLFASFHGAFYFEQYRWDLIKE